MGVANRAAAQLRLAHILNSTKTMKSSCPGQVTRVGGVTKQKTQKQKVYVAISSSGALKARLLYVRYKKIRKCAAK